MTKLSSKPQKSIHLSVKISNENTNATILVLKQRLTEKTLFACSTEQVFFLPGAPEKKANKQTYKPKKTKTKNYSQKQSTKHIHTKRREADPPLSSFRTPLPLKFPLPFRVGLVRRVKAI